MKHSHVEDAEYFNRFESGYTAYSESDLKTITAPLEKVFEKAQSVLAAEIGCASGQFSRLLAERYAGLRIMGIDIAETVLAQYPYEKILASVFDMPLEDACLDLVCLPASLHHFFPFKKSLAEISRVIKPGGWLYCLEPNFYHPQRMFFMRFGWLYRLYRKANDVPIRPDWLVSTLSEMGFEVVDFEYVNLFFRQPSTLQRIQNIFYSVTPRSGMDKYLLPWFMLLARKRI